MKFSRKRRSGGINVTDAEVNRAVQDISFPSDPSAIPAEENLRTDAENKRRVAAAAKDIPEIFTPEDVEWVFNVYVAILCFVYSLLLKCEIEVLSEELTFTKEETAVMAKPLARIASKYAPAEWAGKTAEIQLIVSLGVWTVMSFKRAKRVVEKQNEKKRDAERTQPIDRMRKPGETLVPA